MGDCQGSDQLLPKNMKEILNVEQRKETDCDQKVSEAYVFTADEAAEILKVNKKTIYRLVDRNLLHATKALRHLRITKKSLDQFLAAT